MFSINILMGDIQRCLIIPVETSEDHKFIKFYAKLILLQRSSPSSSNNGVKTLFLQLEFTVKKPSINSFNSHIFLDENLLQLAQAIYPHPRIG